MSSGSLVPSESFQPKGHFDFYLLSSEIGKSMSFSTFTSAKDSPGNNKLDDQKPVLYLGVPTMGMLKHQKIKMKFSVLVKDFEKILNLPVHNHSSIKSHVIHLMKNSKQHETLISPMYCSVAFSAVNLTKLVLIEITYNIATQNFSLNTLEHLKAMDVI